MQLKINGEYYDINVEPNESLLRVLRDHLQLTGTPNGCTPEACTGSCIVLINGKAYPSCKVPVGSLEDDRIRTIEGISELHPVKKAWKDEGIKECPAYKTAHILEAISLLSRMLNPSPEDIEEALNGERCSCAKDPRVIRAINTASKYNYDS